MQPRDLRSWLEWVVTSCPLQLPSTPVSLQGLQLLRPGLLPWAAPGPGRCVPDRAQLWVSLCGRASPQAGMPTPPLMGAQLEFVSKVGKAPQSLPQCSGHPPTWSCKAAITLIALCTPSRSDFAVICSPRAIIRGRNVLLQKTFNIHLNP